MAMFRRTDKQEGHQRSRRAYERLSDSRSKGKMRSPLKPGPVKVGTKKSYGVDKNGRSFVMSPHPHGGFSLSKTWRQSSPSCSPLSRPALRRKVTDPEDRCSRRSKGKA